MKVCKKCNNQFNEKYSYCPKCGSNYDTNEKVKIPILVDYKKYSLFMELQFLLYY